MAWSSTKDTRELFRNPVNARKVVQTISELADKAAQSSDAPKERQIELDGKKYKVIDLELKK